MQDRSPELLRQVLARARSFYARRLEDPRLVQAALDRLIPDTRGGRVGSADAVIEAIYEDLEAKQAVYAAVERRLKPTSRIATNTSRIPLEQLARRLTQPQILVDLHFFNPVARVELVDVVSGAHTNLRVVREARALIGCLQRRPLPVRGAPGFLVNRILLPYLLEAVHLQQEGVPPEVIDQAALGLGLGLVVVPLYTEDSEENVAFVLQD